MWGKLRARKYKNKALCFLDYDCGVIQWVGMGGKIQTNESTFSLQREYLWKTQTMKVDGK